MISNLVTQTQQEGLESCALSAPDMLVIYDKALEAGCPEHDAKEFTNVSECKGKLLLKRALIPLRDNLQPYLTPVEETGDLIPYRVHP